jgi:glycosyltransferase involved in cell wall biosynthesis
MIDSLNEIGIKNFIIPSIKALDVAKWKKVRKLMHDEKIDIVHVHGTRANSNVYWAAKNLGLPIIYTIHGWSFHDDQSWFVKNARICFEQWITKKVDTNISVSRSNQKTGLKYIPHFNSVVINNGIDLKIFNPDSDFKNIRNELGINKDVCVIGFIARMTAQKDPLTLIHAFKKVLEKKPDAVLLMVGDGDLKQKAIELAMSLEMNKQVIFEKFRTDVPDVLNSIDIFCLPSLWEGFPIGLLEAMAMNKAVVATAVDGSKEILQDKQNGILIAQQEVNALANALLLLINDQLLRCKLGNAARQTVVEKFGVEEMTKQVEKLYLSTLHLN